MSFEELSTEYGIRRNHFFKYLQLRSYISAAQGHSLPKPTLSSLEVAIMKNCQSKGLISFWYDFLVLESSESSEKKLNAWCEDIGEDISAEDWSEACTEAQTQTVNTSLKLLQYKWLMRVYITPVKLHKFNDNIPDTCIKCDESRGTLFHCIWECTKTNAFWKDVISMIENILSKKLPLDPKMCILGLYPRTLVLKKEEIKFIDMCMLQAKRTIALGWKNVNGPWIGVWLRQMSSSMSMEKLTYIVRKKSEMFENVWRPFIHFLQNDTNVGNILQQEEEEGE